VLVVKKFNNEGFWVVLLSTKQQPLDFYFNYVDPSGAPLAAVLAQLRRVSINRLRRDIYVLPAALLDEVRAQRAFFALKSKPRREAGFLEASFEALCRAHTPQSRGCKEASSEHHSLALPNGLLFLLVLRSASAAHRSHASATSSNVALCSGFMLFANRLQSSAYLLNFVASSIASL